MEAAVTILIPSYNPGAYLAEALGSVFAQVSRAWKVIVIDDASTDNSLELSQVYLSSPRVTVLESQVNVGQSRALNLGLGAVDTPFALQLDADDWLVPETVGVLLEEARSKPEDVAVFSGNMMAKVENGFGRVVKTYFRSGRLFSDKYEFLASGTSLWPRFYRTRCLRSIGGWPTDDPYQGRHMEDLRVLYRLAEHYRFHWVDRTLYIHRRHPHNNSRNIKAYNEVLEWTVRDALRRWGDVYRPEFETIEEDWKRVAYLVPRDPSGGLKPILPFWRSRPENNPSGNDPARHGHHLGQGEEVSGRHRSGIIYVRTSEGPLTPVEGRTVHGRGPDSHGSNEAWRRPSRGRDD